MRAIQLDEGRTIKPLWLIAVLFAVTLYVPVALTIFDFSLLGGLVQPTLMINAGMLALFALIAFGPGGLRPGDVGWDMQAIASGLIFLLLLWVMNQLLAGALLLMNGDAITLHERLSQPESTLPYVGRFLGQLFGTALTEETIFRGFLVVQLYRLLPAPGGNRWRFALALALAALIFALFHIPQRLIVQQMPLADLSFDLLILFALGVILSLLYLVTGNLFLTTAAHALYNEPFFLLSADDTTYTIYGGVWWAIMLMLIIGFAVHQRRSRPAG